MCGANVIHNHVSYTGLGLACASQEHLLAHALLLGQQLGAPPCPQHCEQFLEGVKEGGKTQHRREQNLLA